LLKKGLFFLLFCSFHLHCQQLSQQVTFQKSSDATKLLVNKGQYQLALETASESLKRKSNMCDDEQIFVWSLIAANALKDFESINFLIKQALTCAPDRKIFWEEAYDLWSKEISFNEDNFFTTAQQNLSQQQYKDLWLLKKKSHTSNNFFFNFKPLFSSNYNNGLVVNYIDIFDIPFKTSDDSKKLKGFGGKINLLNNLRVYETPFKSLDVNLGLTIEEFPSFRGDSLFMQNGISFKDTFFLHPYLISYSYQKRDFAKKPQFSSERLSFQSLNYKNKLFQSFSTSFKKNKYPSSPFQNGNGVELSVQSSADKFIFSPMFERYNAKQNTFSFSGKGFLISDNKKIFNIYFKSNKYRDRFVVFGKTRRDKVYIFSIKLPLNKLIKKNILVNIDYIKNDSNIGIYENYEIKFSINLL